jgi:hypothetical protein
MEKLMLWLCVLIIFFVFTYQREGFSITDPLQKTTMIAPNSMIYPYPYTDMIVATSPNDTFTLLNKTDALTASKIATIYTVFVIPDIAGAIPFETFKAKYNTNHSEQLVFKVYNESPVKYYSYKYTDVSIVPYTTNPLRKLDDIWEFINHTKVTNTTIRNVIASLVERALQQQNKFGTVASICIYHTIPDSATNPNLYIQRIVNFPYLTPYTF